MCSTAEPKDFHLFLHECRHFLLLLFHCVLSYSIRVVNLKVAKLQPWQLWSNKFSSILHGILILTNIVQRFSHPKLGKIFNWNCWCLTSSVSLAVLSWFSCCSLILKLENEQKSVLFRRPIVLRSLFYYGKCSMKTKVAMRWCDFLFFLMTPVLLSAHRLPWLPEFIATNLTRRLKWDWKACKPSFLHHCSKNKVQWTE